MRGDVQCEYPGCNDGRQIRKHFCPKHVATPFTTRAEVNAYRRGRRDERRAMAVVTAGPEGISGKDFLAEVEKMRAEGVELDASAWFEEQRKAGDE